MDKTFNDLMDIVNRTKKIDGIDRPKPRPRPRPVEIEEEYDEDYTPVEYDVVEKPKRTRTVKKDSPDLFEGGAIGKMLGKTTKKSTSTKSKAKSTTKKTTTKKSPAKKTQTTKKAEGTTTPKKTTTPKVKQAPKLTKEDILSEIKVVKEQPKKQAQNSSVDMADPKNAQLYAALKSSLFSGGTDISEYMNMGDNSEAQNSLKELRAKREAQKINQEITKEQQEYEQLFTGALDNVYQNNQEEEFVEDEQVDNSTINVAEKNAQLANELNAIKANLASKKNAPDTVSNQAKTVNRHDDAYELNSGNKDLDKKIAEYYKRKQEKINAYKVQEQQGILDDDRDDDTDNAPIDYEAIFGGSMMTRDQLLGIEREPEQEVVEEAEESAVEDVVDTQEPEATVSEEPLQESEENQVEDVQEEVQEDVQEPAQEDRQVDESETETAESSEQVVEEDDSTQKPENRDEHIKSLLSDLLFSKKNKAEEESEESLEETAENEELSHADKAREYASLFGGAVDEADLAEDTANEVVEETAEQQDEEEPEMTDETVEESSESEESDNEEAETVAEVEEEPEEELSEEELLDSLTLNFGGSTIIDKDTTVEDLANAEEGQETSDEADLAEDTANEVVEETAEQQEIEEPAINDEVEEFPEAESTGENEELAEEDSETPVEEVEEEATETQSEQEETEENVIEGNEEAEEQGFVLVDTPQVFGDFDEENPQEVTPYVDRTPATQEELDAEQEQTTEEVPQEDTQEDLNVVEDSEEAQVEDEYDEHFESVVTNERNYENTTKRDDVAPALDDPEDNFYVVDTLPENRYDVLGNEVKPVDEDGNEIEEEVVEEKKDDTISKEEFYNEMARLQENLINELKGNAQVEGRDLFEEKKEDPIEEEKVNSVVEELIEQFDEEEEEIEEEVEILAPESEPEVVSAEEVICKAEPVDPEHFDDYNLLNKDEPLNDDDLAFQEKSEEDKAPEKDAYFYLSPEDNEKKKEEADEYVQLFDDEPAKFKEVGDIHIFKNIGNAVPSSEILKEVEKNESSEVQANNDADEIEAIYTLMGIERKPVSKPQEDMKVLYVASECQPFCASGGLGDVAGSLPNAIAKKGGVDIRVIMPLYGNIKSEYRDKFEYLGNFTVHLSWRQEYCGLFRYYKDGVTYYFIDNERYFKRDMLYGYYDDGERFAYFSKAIVEALPHINFFPDIIHCNDWQSALVSTYIKTGNWSDYRYYKIKHIYTIHNVEYQGVYGMENLKDLFGIDPRFHNDLDYNGDINLTKAAIHFSDKFTTVSRSYCENLKQPYCSRGLHHIIIRNEYKLSGIINGIDYDFYNPATDPNLFKNYDFGCMEEKVLNKKSWQDELGLPVDGETPMIAIVSRLVGHKGLDLVTKIIENTLQQDIQLVVVGTGDKKYVDYFKYLEQKYPTKVRALVDKYSNENARRAYAASDIFVMPSKIEPCGISQMIASRYGSVPIVRETGGLKDTIQDFGCPDGGNGYTFTNYNPNDLSYQLNRAIKEYGDKSGWREKMKTVMNVDFTWNKPADGYIDLYKSVCDK